MFHLFIHNVIGREESHNKGLSEVENSYLQSFRTDSGIDSLRCYEELNKYIAHIILSQNKIAFLEILEVLIDKGYRLDPNLLYMIEPLFLLFKPRLSSILRLSKIFVLADADHKSLADNDMLTEEINILKYIYLIYRQHIEDDTGVVSCRDIRRVHNSRALHDDDKIRLLSYLTTS